MLICVMSGSQILSINTNGKMTLCSAMEESNIILGDIDDWILIL